MFFKLEKGIIKTIKYFEFFDYLPSFEEIYIFLPFKITKNQLKDQILILERQKKIKSIFALWRNEYLYTVGEYSIKFKVKNLKLKIKKLENRWKESERKLKNWRFRLYIKLLKLLPFIKLVGLSGTISMKNAKKDDDIDLFIITSKNRLFIGRFLAVLIAFIIGLKRQLGQKKATNKVCLNLFFDESNLKVPDFKKTEYVGHELLQMKPIINKFYVYEEFLRVNQWVKKLFPNSLKLISKIHLLSQKEIKNQNLKLQSKNKKLSVFDIIENILKKLQLFIINRHKTSEIITDTQLWFHPDDYNEKIKHENIKL